MDYGSGRNYVDAGFDRRVRLSPQVKFRARFTLYSTPLVLGILQRVKKPLHFVVT
jgi:hypothetical protein